MRSRRAEAATPQLSFLDEPDVQGPLTGAPCPRGAAPASRSVSASRRSKRADRRPLSPAESLQYCHALLAEIDRVAQVEKERAQREEAARSARRQEERIHRLATLFEAAIGTTPSADERGRAPAGTREERRVPA